MDKYQQFTQQFFDTFPQTNFILSTYNQFLQNIAEIIQNFDFRYSYKNNFGERITINYELVNESDNIQQINVRSILNAYLCRNREDDLLQKFQFDIKFKVINEQTGEVKYISSRNKFNFEIPILSLTYLDPVLRMNTLEKWNKGVDLNTIGGDLILAGVKYILPNLFSFPFNKPIVVVADKAKQVVRTEYLRQVIPIFGNSYYTSYHIVVDKNKIPDIVVYIKQNHDLRFNKDNKKNTPIYIPILLLFYVYGIKNDYEFLQICNKFQEKQFNLFLINCIRTGEFHQILFNKFPNFRQNPKEILAKYILIPDYQSQISQILEKYIHPLNSNFYIILQDIIYKMYQVYNDPSNSFDKDSLQNKRIRTVSEQVVEQLRSRMSENYKTEMSTLENNQLKYTKFEDIENVKTNLENTISNYSQKITKTIKRSFTSPNTSLAIQQSSTLKKVQNEYKTINYDLIQKREIVIRSEGKGKTTWQQRKVQNSFFGFIDPVQTPEAGINVGRYLSPTIYAQITKGQIIDEVLQYIQSHRYYIPENISHNIHLMPIKINYVTYGFVHWDNFKRMYIDLLIWRSQEFSRTFISICYSIEHVELNILTDMGRIMIPIFHNISSLDDLFVEESSEDSSSNSPSEDSSSNDSSSSSPNNPSKDKNSEGLIKKLLKQRKILFICPEMMNNFIVEEFPKFINQDTNQLISIQLDPKKYYLLPYSTLSPITSTNPFISHMKSIRASYSCPQQKQGITCPNTNFMNQTPNNQLILHKLQRSPIQTFIQNTIYSHIPIGNLVYIAIMEYCFNQEDAIISSQGYFNRGGLQVSEYKTIYQSLSKAKDQFNVDMSILDKFKDQYHLLENTYYPENHYKPKIPIINNKEPVLTPFFVPQKIGQSIKLDDVIIPCISINNKKIQTHNITYQNESETKYVLISNVNMYYTSVQQSSKMTRIQLARQTNIGDKFISRNAQKGTIGRIEFEYDLPLNELGFIPNFILSSQSILKRETYGQLIEPVLNNYLCQNQQYVCNHDMYTEFNMSKLTDIQPNILIGQDGKMIKNPITCGPITYIPYCHLIDNKIRARNDGAIDQITKQPISGKKNDGGLKTGTLDVSALFTQGIINTMRHQFGQNSSNCQWYYCKLCQNISVYQPRTYKNQDQCKKFYCEYCKKFIPESNVGYGSYNYGLKFYNDVLFSIGCSLKIIPQQQNQK